MADFIGRAALETIANKFSPQIIMGAARFRPDVFTRMKINIETGVQYQSTKTVMLRKGHTTQKKVVGDEVNSTAGTCKSGGAIFNYPLCTRMEPLQGQPRQLSRTCYRGH